MKWLNNGNTSKSEVKVTTFIHDVVLLPSFNHNDLIAFDAHCENQHLDKALLELALLSQFTESTVDILVPSGDSSIAPKTFAVPGLLHRKLTSVICEVFESPLAHLYHLSPFKQFRKSLKSGRKEHIYDKIYTTEAFLEETEHVRQHGKLPPDDLGCKREKVVLACMFSSDATLLVDFRVQKAWPLYFMSGNLSKYIRAQPDARGMHHLAYIPLVGNNLSCCYLADCFGYSCLNCSRNSHRRFI